MDIKECKNLLEKSLKMNIFNSTIISEILFEPAFECLGKAVYCQLRYKNDELLICYEHFSRYEFLTLAYNENPSKIKENIFTDNYCGIIISDIDTKNRVEELLDTIKQFKNKKIKTTVGLDGFSHTVILNDYTYYWWNEPISQEAEILDKFVSEVFSLLPKDFRKT